MYQSFEIIYILHKNKKQLLYKQYNNLYFHYEMDSKNNKNKYLKDLKIKEVIIEDTYS